MGGCGTRGFDIATRMVNFLAGGGNIFIAITGFEYGGRLYKNSKQEAVLYIVLSLWLLLMGFLQMVAEIRWRKLVNPFRFLKVALFRGIFGALIGASVIIIGAEHPFASVWSIGIVSAVGGVMNIVLAFPCFPPAFPEMAKEDDIEAAALAQAEGDKGQSLMGNEVPTI